MNFSSTTSTTHTKFTRDQSIASAVQQLPYYIICAGLGALSGALGTALAIGLAIMVQLSLPPDTIFWPGIIPVAAVAVVLGTAIAWFMHRGIHRMLPTLPQSSFMQGLQVALVISGLVSLLEAALFMHGL